MHMTLYWGKKVTLLISSWKTNSWTSYLLALLACFLFSAFYQFMEDRRLRFKALASSSSINPSSLPVGTPLLFQVNRGRRLSPARVATAVLFGVNSAIGYLLMLAVMSFNGGVLVAIVMGLSVGFFLFRTEDEDVVVVDHPCACS